MMWRSLRLIFLIFSFVAAVYSQGPPPLQLQSVLLPSPAIGRPYNAAIQITGGTPPLRWAIVAGKLPIGVTLQPETGILAGTPTEPGSNRFTVAVTDAAGQRLVHEYTMAVEDYLVVIFQKGPLLNSNELSGAVEVRNESNDNYDLTAVVVAVNEIGKAFALGYQRFNLPAKGNQNVPFVSTLPNGNYVVHVDAIARLTRSNSLRYANLQTPSAITVNVNR